MQNFLRDVRNLPIWGDCPFSDRIPAGIEVRKGRFFGDADQVVVLWRPGRRSEGAHIDITFDANAASRPDYFERSSAPALAMLAGS